MENTIIIINAGDIPAAVHMAKDLTPYTVLTFDPVLEDKITASGLHHVQFIPWDNCPLYHELDAEANAAAFALEAELDMAIRHIVPDLSIAAWQHLNLYYLFMMLKWYSGLWDELGSRLSGAKAHIFICDNPASYYFNSFIPSLLLLWHLKRHDIEFSAYTYGNKPDDASLIPDLLGVNSVEHVEQILAHLPTCMYDFSYFDQEILSSGKTLINLESKCFNTPLSAQKSLGLVSTEDAIATLPEPLQIKIHAFFQHMAATLDKLLKPFIVIPDYRTRQVLYISHLYRSQLVTYYQLDRYFEPSKPSKVLLSDHDAGFHGPLVSFAQKHFIPVLLLPHAKTSADIEFKYGNIVALTHPIQGRDIFDARGKIVSNEKIAYPESFSGSSIAHGGIKTISLLLNGLSLNGVYYTRCAAYLGGIRQIVAWCRAQGIALKVRCKPSYAIIQMLARDTGLDLAMLCQSANESMEQHVENCDLCLMYDQPTSGALYFLRNAIPILNPIVEPLSSAEKTMVNARVVPQESIDASLYRLKGFVSDPLSLFLFRNAQFGDYIQLFQNAKPLRVNL